MYVILTVYTRSVVYSIQYTQYLYYKCAHLFFMTCKFLVCINIIYLDDFQYAFPNCFNAMQSSKTTSPCWMAEVCNLHQQANLHDQLWNCLLYGFPCPKTSRCLNVLTCMNYIHFRILLSHLWGFPMAGGCNHLQGAKGMVVGQKHPFFYAISVPI